MLDRLQQAGEALTPGQVRERLGGDLAYSTVVTTLTRLYDKQVLTRVPAGRAYAYRPATDASGLAARRMHQVLSGGPDRAQVLTRFVGTLTESDAAVLRALLGSGPAGDSPKESG